MLSTTHIHKHYSDTSLPSPSDAPDHSADQQLAPDQLPDLFLEMIGLNDSLSRVEELYREEE